MSRIVWLAFWIRTVTHFSKIWNGFFIIGELMLYVLLISHTRWSCYGFSSVLVAMTNIYDSKKEKKGRFSQAVSTLVVCCFRCDLRVGYDWVHTRNFGRAGRNVGQNFDYYFFFAPVAKKKFCKLQKKKMKSVDFLPVSATNRKIEISLFLDEVMNSFEKSYFCVTNISSN